MTPLTPKEVAKALPRDNTRNEANDIARGLARAATGGYPVTKDTIIFWLDVAREIGRDLATDLGGTR